MATLPITSSLRRLPPVASEQGAGVPHRSRLAAPAPIRTTERVIRDEESFHRFADAIPKKEMDFVPDPPPSTDPLLRRPTIDFESLMMLVVIAHDPNRVVDVEIERLELRSGSMKVHWRFDEPRFAQKNISYGTCHAVLVNRFDGEVVFMRSRASAAEATDPQEPGAPSCTS